MKIHELKREPDACGFISLINKVSPLSVVGRKLLLNLSFMTDRSSISNELDNTEKVTTILADKNNSKTLHSIYSLFSEIRDIENTLLKLSAGEVLNDVELFEIKHFALVAKMFFEQIKHLEINKLNYIFNFDDTLFENVIKILDPEKTSVPTFYIYDAYSEELSKLRKERKHHKDEGQKQILQSRIFGIEQTIRKKLSNILTAYSDALIIALNTIAYFDLLFAKADFAIQHTLCKPQISDKNTEYKEIFNPIVKIKIEETGNIYQKIDIAFGNYPTLITGINMGGKTLMLKTLYVCQMLFQYGFFVPATRAKIVVVEKIMFSLTDNQNQEQGLSSFASEMVNINSIIEQISVNNNILVLIDELARTTNPIEGSALVSSMLDLLEENSVSSFITTHYDITTISKRLRVKGLKDDFCNQTTDISQNIGTSGSINTKLLLKNIDFQLIEDTSCITPNEAIRISELLGVNNVLIDKAKIKLKNNKK